MNDGLKKKIIKIVNRCFSSLVIIGIIGALVFSTPAIAYADPNRGDQKEDIAKLLNSIRSSFAIAATQGQKETLKESPRYSIKDGYLLSVGAPPGQYFPVTSVVPKNPELTASNFLSEQSKAFGIRGTAVSFKALKVKAGDTHSYVRFQQTYASIPVFAAETIVQLNPAGGVESVLSDIMRNTGPLDDGRLSPLPSVSTEDARKSAVALLANENPGLNLSASTPVLMIYDPSVVGNNGPVRLVWNTVITSAGPPDINECVLVDARTSEIAFRYPLNPNALSRKVYDANNTSSDPGTLRRSEGQSPSGIADVDKAYDYSGDTYDFYYNHHNRDGIDGNGMVISATVRYYPAAGNAWWDSTNDRIYFGTGYAVDDVTGHELTHGVTQYESDLIYSNESGAINESFSDIWGEFVDLENGRGTDTPAVRWLMGEDLPIGAIRNMANPPAYNQPDRMGSALWYTGTGDNGGVHINSGVGNKLAYLLTDGGAFNGYTIWSMGISRAAGLFYEVQTNLLTSGAGYNDLDIQLMQAAINLGWNSTDKSNLWQALKAVELEGLTPHFILKWGSYGSGDGQFGNPYGVCSDPQGNIYVVDKNNNRIQKFTQDGAFITKWGSSGSGNGKFYYPYGICSDPYGNIYVADTNNNRIQKFTQDGAFITKWGSYGSGNGQFNYPEGICSDPYGNIYVADTNSRRVQKFTQDGAFITKWGSSGSGDSQFSYPTSVCSDPQGNIYVTDQNNNRIQKFTQDGAFITKWGSYGSGNGQFNYPYGVCSDTQGNIYVTDKYNNRIQKFTQDGAFITKWGSYGQIEYPYGICSDPQRNIYVVIMAGNRIVKFGYIIIDSDPLMLAADLDGNNQDDAIVDFGFSYGIWIYYNNSTWTKLHDISPESITKGNLDSDPKEDLIIDFGSAHSIWIRYNDSTWTKLHDITPESILTSDLDNNGQDEIIIDFGPTYGIWIYYNNSTWAKLHNLSPKSMTTGSLDSEPKKDLIIDFGDQYGVWIYYNNSTWQQLHSVSPESIVTADLDGSGQQNIVIDFGPQHGIWIYYNNSTWTKLHDLSPDSIVAGNLDLDPKKDLIIDFGSLYGIWIKYNDSTWTKLHDLSPDFIVAGDMNGNGQDDVIVDFGPQYGVWVYYDNGSWSKLHDLSP